MTKDLILQEIKRIAAESNGKAPGQKLFFGLTGIKPYSWQGKYWLRWSDALQEAGLEANTKTEAFSDEVLLGRLCDLAIELGHYPSLTELKMKRSQDQSFPGEKAYRDRYGRKVLVVDKVRQFLTGKSRYAAVASMLPVAVEQEDNSDEAGGEDSGEFTEGYIYLIKCGKHHKIGKTKDIGRRYSQLRILLPEKSVLEHQILTDDIDGIEAYWHKRYADRRQEGEWFLLSRSDVRAFKKRKTM